MKAKFLVAALSAIALTACNNDEVLEVNRGRGISFQVATESPARATATTTGTITAFTVWGFTDGSTLMNDVDVTKSGSTWTYDNIIFWPEADVDFYSISPVPSSDKISEGTVSIASDKQTITGFTVNEEESQQVDLLYAVNRGEKKASHETTPVSINFRHALSQIVFKAKNTNANLKVIINGVKVVNINKKGDFAYPTTGSTTTHYDYEANETNTTIAVQGTWTNIESLETFEAGITSQTLTGANTTAVDLTTKTGSAYSGSLLMLPQELTPWNTSIGCENDANKGAYFLVDCQIFSGTNKDIQVWPATGNTSAEVAIPVTDMEWEQGKMYIYTFIFGDGGGYIPGTDPDPDPALIGIDFTVTVDEFLDGGNTDIDMETEKE